MGKLDSLQALVGNDLRVFRKLCFEQMEPIEPTDLGESEEGDWRYRVESLNRFENYRIGGIVGGAQPSEYSESPDLWHPFFRALGIEGAFLCFDLPVEKSLDAFAEAFLSVEGAIDLTVTDPYKKEAFSLLTRSQSNIQFAPQAEELGIVNHIICDEKSSLIHALNTDGTGMVSAIQRYLTLTAKNVVLIGAGATGTSIGYECVQEGANLVIADKVQNRSKELAERLERYSATGVKVEAVALEDLPDSLGEADGVVVAVSEGIGLSESDLKLVRKGAVIADTRYGDNSPLSKRLKNDRRLFVDGRQMLRGQFLEAAKVVSNVLGVADLHFEAVKRFVTHGYT